VFIDEIDTILGNRNKSSHTAYSSTLGLFLSEWDGLTSTPNSAPVVVLGATNRPQDIDEAFRRRMPVSIETRAPSLLGRVEILEKMLTNESLDPDMSIQDVAVLTEGYTGSDLRELVRATNTVRAKEVLGSFKEYQKQRTSGNVFAPSQELRPLCTEDFMYALSRAKNSGEELLLY
jgi:SpoVK/Ycf46/Vps4 family AAA+-type ATPase